MVRNGNGYVFYYFLEDGLDNGDGTYSPAWVDDAASPVEDDFVVGTGFWFLNPTDPNCEFTLSGEVPAEESIDLDYKADYNLTGNPYPVSFGLEDVTFDGLVGAWWDIDNTWYETAPQVMVRVGDGYIFYYYLEDGLDNGDGTYSPAWVDDAATPVEGTLKIESGAAFWFKGTTPVKATYSIK